MARHPAKEIVVIGGEERVPYIYMMDRPKVMKIADDTTLIRKLDRQNGAITALAWSPDGQADRGGGRGAGSQHLRCRDRRARRRRARDTPPGSTPWPSAPIAATLAAGGFDGMVRLYDAATGKLKREFIPVPLEKSGEARGSR